MFNSGCLIKPYGLVIDGINFEFRFVKARSGLNVVPQHANLKLH